MASLKEHRIWCLDLGAMRLGGRGFVAERGAEAAAAGAGGKLSISKEEYVECRKRVILCVLWLVMMM